MSGGVATYSQEQDLLTRLTSVPRCLPLDYVALKTILLAASLAYRTSRSPYTTQADVSIQFGVAENL